MEVYRESDKKRLSHSNLYRANIYARLDYNSELNAASVVISSWEKGLSHQKGCSGRAEIATAGRENKPNVAGNKKPLPQFLQTLYTGKCQQPSGKERNERNKW